MCTKEFGKAGEKVSVLGFWGMRFDPEDEEGAIRTIHRAVELGINYFDIAPGYCEDKSETFIGKALDLLPEEKKQSVYVSTKSHYMSESTADNVRRRIDSQLKTLRLETISFYNMWYIMDMKQFKAIRHSKDPTTLTVLFEDSLALMGLMIAIAAITLVHFTGILAIDAVASMIIGVLLMVFALFLANETNILLVGEAVTPLKREQILGCLHSCDEVDKVVSLKTMHLSPDEVIVAVEVDYRNDITVHELEVLNDRIEKSIKEVIPNAKVYLEAENK